jgi:hypothetical protein
MSKSLKFGFLILIFLLVGTRLKAQLAVGGVIFDASTGETLPGASIYIPGSTIGVSSNKNGQFRLETSQKPPIQVNVSFIGYQTLTFQVDSSQTELRFSLFPKSLEMQEVFVEAPKEHHWRDFVEAFIGYSDWSEQCEIQNVEDINLSFNKEENRLEAYAQKPIRINNKALGFSITYWLETFVYDYRSNRIQVLGYPQFTDQLNESTWWWKRSKWSKNRKKAYWGSINHFVSSLVNQTMEQEGFEIDYMMRVPVGASYPDSVKQIDTLRYSNDALVEIYKKTQSSSVIGTFPNRALVERFQKWFLNPHQREVLRLKIPMETEFGNETRIHEFTKNTGLDSTFIWTSYWMNQQKENQAKSGYMNMVTHQNIDPQKYVNRISEDSVYLSFPDYWVVYYTKEKEEKAYQQRMFGRVNSDKKGQTSIFSLTYEQKVRLFPDGNRYPADGMLTELYWGFEKLDTWLPMDYEPTK